MTYPFQMGLGQPIRLATSVAVLMLCMVCANGQSPSAPQPTTPPVNNPCVDQPKSVDCTLFLIDQFTTRFNTFEKNVNQDSQVLTTFLDKRILALEAKIVTLEAKIVTLESQLGTIRTDVTGAQQKLTGTSGKADGIDDIWARIATIERELKLRPKSQ